MGNTRAHPALLIADTPGPSQSFHLFTGNTVRPFMSKPTTLPQETDFNAPALLAACVLPGLGHFVRGEKQRAAYIATGVLGLFVGGIFLGGVDVIDRQEDKVWFIGQALVGPLAFGVDYYHQHHLKVFGQDQDSRSTQARWRSAYPNEGRGLDGKAVPGGIPPNTKSVGRMNELGTLSAALAGMINLIVIIDAGFPTIRPRRRSDQLGIGPGGTIATGSNLPSAGGNA